MRLRSDGAPPRAAYGAPMRWLAVLLAACPLVRSAEPAPPAPAPAHATRAAQATRAADAGPQPLASRAEDLAAIYPALMALSAGDPGAIEALPAHLFLAPAATPDPADPALLRRWTLDLPEALARLPPATRATALEALDRRFHALGATADAETRARLALAFLPAPAARAALAAAADRAFDHGRLRRFLALAARLDLTGDPRVAAARRLLGTGAEIDPELALGAPGRPVETAATPAATPAGATVAFVAAPGWLLACDPWGTVLWQYRLEHRATVVPGDGGALILDSAGLRLLDERGAATTLPPPPAGARLLAVAGGAAWFATGPTVYRLDLADRQVQALDLPSPPLAPPLVRGPSSLWLTAQELLLVADGVIRERFAHGLAAEPGWRLGVDGDRPLLVDATGRAFRLAPLADQLAEATPGGRMRLLLRASRPAEALALWRDSPHLAADPAARALALRALLADPAAVAADPAAALALAADPQERATVLAAAGGRDDPRLGAELTLLAERHPDVLIAPDAEARGADPDAWPWVIAGRAWSGRAGGLGAWRLPPARRAAVATVAVAGAAPAPARRLPDASWEYRGWRYRCEANLTTTEVTCREPDGALRWRRRWLAPDPLAAPGRSLAIRDGALAVVEGSARLTVLDAVSGERWAALRPAGEILPQQIVLIGREHVADLGPLGLDTTLRLLQPDGATVMPLPAPARWMVPWGDGVLVASTDGRAIAHPGGTAVQLPDELVRGPAPAVTAEGLVRDGRCWAWR